MCELTGACVALTMEIRASCLATFVKINLKALQTKCRLCHNGTKSQQRQQRENGDERNCMSLSRIQKTTKTLNAWNGFVHFAILP